MFYVMRAKVKALMQLCGGGLYFHYLSGQVLCHSYDPVGQYVSLLRLSASICVTIYLTLISRWPLASRIRSASIATVSHCISPALLYPRRLHGPKNTGPGERTAAASAKFSLPLKIHKKHRLVYIPPRIAAKNAAQFCNQMNRFGPEEREKKKSIAIRVNTAMEERFGMLKRND